MDRDTRINLYENREKKCCCTCGLEKDYNEFYKDASKPDGLYVRCKSCHLNACAEYRKNNSNKVRKWREDNRDYLLEQKKLYYRKNKKKHNIKNRQWAIAHKDILKEYIRNYNITNAHRIKSMRKEYRKAHFEKITQKNITYHRLNRIELKDSYVKTLLRRYKVASFPKHVLELKRTQIKLKRTICKTEK